MRIVIGVIGVLAACVFIGQSAVTLGQTAYNMASNDEVWRQALMAAGASSVVIYEGIGLVFAGLLWHVGKRWLAFGCCMLVLAAAVYTVRLELAYNVTGQADRIAERQASTERRETAKSDLAYYRAQRAEMGTVPAVGAVQADIDALKQHERWGPDYTAGCTNATVPDSIAFCKQYHALEAQLASAKKLEEINTKIEELEKQRGWVPVNAGGAPDAAWAARNFGGGEQGWADAFMVFGILFWVLARTLALPIAVGAMAVRRREEVPSVQEAVASKPQDDHGEQLARIDTTNIIPLERNREQPEPDLVSIVVNEVRAEGCKSIRFYKLMNRVRKLAKHLEKPCPSETSVGLRMGELGFGKGRERDERNRLITVYDLGSGGAQTELAEAA